ncbi:hypothetical protein HDC90_004821 [Pedobacter sp. AK013]|uniref:hypothetical protein n=1 Tax=Pedobacter sp. AK013 TaxID=2723071 RepID=UPI001616AEAD|nr:hypothetical protein [Pedobacter sp. AK013]MBB6240156.1 hypothetical protein [Pedobacter sp. AK013]
MTSVNLFGQYYFEKRGLVRFGSESPAIPSSPRCAPGFSFYQVYLTKISNSSGTSNSALRNFTQPHWSASTKPTLLSTIGFAFKKTKNRFFSQYKHVTKALPLKFTYNFKNLTFGLSFFKRCKRFTPNTKRIAD